MTQGPYTKPGRLSDVLALIQVLALDQATYRSEPGIIEKELLGSPKSAEEGWMALAQEHPELFRINTESEHGLSLIARHVLPHAKGERRPPLSADFTQRLIDTAIDLHDRQVNAAERWKSFMPLWTAIIAALVTGVLLMVSTHLTLRSVRPPQAGRFVAAEGFGSAQILLDTATGQLCFAGTAAGTKEPNQNLPSCLDLH